MKNKNEDHDIPIPIMVVGAAIAISVTLFMIAGFLGYPSTPDFVESHGSLIAGVLGLIGVYALIRHQSKENAELIKNNIKLMKSEAFEAQRLRALEYAVSIQSKLDELHNSPTACFYRWIADRGLKNDLFREIKGGIFFIENFIRKDANGPIIFQAIPSFIKIYELHGWLNPPYGSGSNNPYSNYNFTSLMGDLVNIYDLDIVDNGLFHYSHSNGRNLKPHDFYNNHMIYSQHVLCGYITGYLTNVVMPALIDNIQKQEILT